MNRKKQTLGWIRESIGLTASIGSAVWTVDAARNLARATGTSYCEALCLFCLTLVPLAIPLMFWWSTPRATEQSWRWGRATLAPVLIWGAARLFLFVAPILF